MTACRSSKRAVRLLAIRDALHERPYTATQLAAMMEVSVQTIYDDLTDLQLPPLNVPLQADRQGRWHVVDMMIDS